MKDKKDKIYYFQEKSNDILDLQDELTAEEIGIYFILKAGYFKYAGELKKENANQRCKFFGDINKFNSVIDKLFDDINGFLVNNSWLSEINDIKKLSEKRKEIAKSRWESKQQKNEKEDEIKSNETKELKETEKDFETFWNFYTPVCAKDGTYTNKGSKQKALISYKKARKKFEHDKIMTCLKLYLEDCQKRGGYTMHAVRWLNNAMEDDFEYEQVIPIQSQIKPTFLTKEQKDQEMYDNFLNGKN